MSADTFTPAALGYLDDHACDREMAELLGIYSDRNSIVFPYVDAAGEKYFRLKSLEDGITYQPKGRSLDLWTPVDTDGVLLVCEGESDCTAAISALYSPMNLAEEDEEPEWEFDRLGDVPPPVAELAPIAVPGVNSCHQKVADLAKQELADVVIVFDGDSAGRENAKKLKEKIEATANVTTTIVDLPDGKDLSDVLAAAEDPVEALAELIAEALAAEEVHVDAHVPASNSAASPPEDVGVLLDAAGDFLDRYVVLPGEHERMAIILFVAHTYVVAGAHATPYMLVLSAEKRSGKTRLMESMGLLVKDPWPVIGASEAAIFRKIAKDRPTMLLDEIDALWGSNSERMEPLRAILNAGNRPGATVARCVGENKDVEDFPIYCAKVLAGIDNGRTPDTLRDRSVTIRMVRKTAAEPVERFRHRLADCEVGPLREGLEDWGAPSRPNQPPRALATGLP
ncbi:MAG: toprim domain-containing protein [Thermoleophilia bacterium]|nr:toprim domain-containing protein [Thermoleophilia bacterium]